MSECFYADHFILSRDLIVGMNCPQTSVVICNIILHTSLFVVSLLNIQLVRLIVYLMFIYYSWQIGKIALDHEDERVLGLHLLQFSEVGHVKRICGS